MFGLGYQSRITEQSEVILNFEIMKTFQSVKTLMNARVAQLVERQPSKLNVAGSNPVSRSKLVLA